MGCSYTGSAGGAIPTDTTNCANDATGMVSIRSVSNNKRILCIFYHLATSSFDCPVVPCCCGLRGLRGTISARNVLMTPSRSQILLIEMFSFRSCRNLFKKAQVRHASHQFSGWKEDGSRRGRQIASSKAGR